jgi:16S rRNA (cytosine1402-N4)-methyltransferase
MSGQPAAVSHQPVMSAEALELLAPRPGAVVVDGTVGGGGHSLCLLPRLLPDGRLIAVDRDAAALAAARRRLVEFTPQISFVRDDYRNLPRILRELGLPPVDGLLLDLGMSSLQLDDAARGFSFSREGPLDMRMDNRQARTAATLVNELGAEELAAMFRTLGEERFARRIARRIVQARRARPIVTTTQLARLVAEAVPGRGRRERIHPATRTFQALRLAVNDELGALEASLAQLPELLGPGGRAVVIAFHSLEDRLVKRAFARGEREGRWAVLTKKPLRPSREEAARNPRARSAKLRAIERGGP